MRYIDPHIHMVSRTTDDYQRMAQSGCVAVTEPAFWAGFDRSSAQGFFDYFRQLTEYEPRRAALFGIRHFTWLCINPKEADDPAFAREVVSIIPEFLKCDTVLGIGEIGLNKNTRNELIILQPFGQPRLCFSNLLLARNDILQLQERLLRLRASADFPNSKFFLIFLLFDMSIKFILAQMIKLSAIILELRVNS